MKLFWKIFLSIITVTTAIFCISGHILIYSFFDSFLENEIEAGKRINLSFCLSLESTMLSDEEEKQISDADIAREAKIVHVLDAAELKQLWVCNENLKVLCKVMEADETALDKNLLRKTSVDTTSYKIKEESGRYYLYIVNVAELKGRRCYVESVNEVTDIFQQKDRQYQIYMSCMFVLLLVTTALILILSLWIVHPIRRLSQAVKEIGQGEFKRKIPVSGNDELSVLAGEFNQMSERLEESMEELRMAAVRQEEFTGSFAHELKTPLTSIIGYADMLRSKKMTEETRMIYGNYIFQQGKRLESLSKKMLELLVLEKTDFVMREIFLEDMFEQIRDELQLILEEKNILFESEAEEISLQAEPDLLKTVFLNFIDNSIKAIGKNGCILIRAESRNDEVVVYVTDTGKGIPQKDIEKVTESFYMVDKSRKYEGGSAGLGLAICKKVLELHRAKMEIESEEGKGTTIMIHFGGVL